MSAKPVNTNPPFTPPSAEELAVLQDPRVLAMQPPTRDFPRHLVLPPREPILAPSRFLNVVTHWGTRTSHRLEWINWPRFDREAGRGCGFGGVKERPSAFQNVPRPAKPPHVWSPESHARWLVVSPEVRDIFCRHGAADVEFCPVDWEYRDGTRLEGYGMLDVINLLPAYDYARSRIDVKWAAHTNKHIEFRVPVVLRADIPPDVHFFREERWRHLFVSRELAAELAPFAAKDLLFTDPHVHYTVVQFGRRRPKTPARPAPPPAIVHELPSAPRDPDAQRRRRTSNEIVPLLDAGDFAAAEDKLVGWLRELPESPLHVAIAPGVGITTPPAEVAKYLDAFVAEATKQQKPKALYAELNQFEINPDVWFFGLFAFAEDGGREEYEWLGNFFASTELQFGIEGLEPLQSVYVARQGDRDLFRGHDEARRLVELLVIVRFQRLLQDALALAKCRVPLLAGAHDHDDAYTVQIKRTARRATD